MPATTRSAQYPEHGLFWPSGSGTLHLDSADQQRDIIARFGRFQHRNAVLDRASKTREQEFLQRGPRYGQ